MTWPDDRVFQHLNPVQALGLACVMCGLPYRPGEAPLVEPVGTSESGARVFACAGSCAELARLDS